MPRVAATGACLGSFDWRWILVAGQFFGRMLARPDQRQALSRALIRPRIALLSLLLGSYALPQTAAYRVSCRIGNPALLATSRASSPQAFRVDCKMPDLVHRFGSEPDISGPAAGSASVANDESRPNPASRRTLSLLLPTCQYPQQQTLQIPLA